MDLELIRILIVHHQAMFREGLRRLLEAEPDLRVIADSDDADQVVDLVMEFKPDVLLLDTARLQSRSGISGIQILHQLSSVRHNARLILINADMNNGSVIEAIKMGVRGVLPNQSGIALFVKCIRTVMAGGYWISRAAVSELIVSLTLLNTQVESRAKLLGCRFSQRELQVLRAIVYGYSNKDIAKELSISEQAVKYHLTHMFRKVGVSGRMALARYTIDHRLVQDA